MGGGWSTGHLFMFWDALHVFEPSTHMSWSVEWCGSISAPYIWATLQLCARQSVLCINRWHWHVIMCLSTPWLRERESEWGGVRTPTPRCHHQPQGVTTVGGIGSAKGGLIETDVASGGFVYWMKLLQNWWCGFAPHNRLLMRPSFLQQLRQSFAKLRFAMQALTCSTHVLQYIYYIVSFYCETIKWLRSEEAAMVSTSSPYIPLLLIYFILFSFYIFHEETCLVPSHYHPPTPSLLLWWWLSVFLSPPHFLHNQPSASFLLRALLLPASSHT